VAINPETEAAIRHTRAAMMHGHVGAIDQEVAAAPAHDQARPRLGRHSPYIDLRWCALWPDLRRMPMSVAAAPLAVPALTSPSRLTLWICSTHSVRAHRLALAQVRPIKASLEQQVALWLDQRPLKNTVASTMATTLATAPLREAMSVAVPLGALLL